MEHQHTDDATLWLTWTFMCHSSFYRKTSRQILDLNTAHYSVCTALQKMVYHNKISDTDRLKCVLIDCWTQLSLHTLNQVINQLPKNYSYYMFELKIKQNQCIFVKFSIISDTANIYANEQRIFKYTDMQVLCFFWTKFCHFWLITYVSPINHRKVINSPKQSVFWPTLYVTEGTFCNQSWCQY